MQGWPGRGHFNDSATDAPKIIINIVETSTTSHMILKAFSLVNLKLKPNPKFGLECILSYVDLS